MAATNNTTGQQQNQQLHSYNGKLLIDKDNLKDEDFDKLVLDISNIVSSRGDLVDGRQKCRNQKQSSPISPNESIECLCANASDLIAAAAASSCSSSNSPLPAEPTYNRLQQPKRPMNAFMVWGRAIRREIHLRFSNVQNALLSKALGRVWRSLDSASREPYVREANLIKANHRRDYPDYRYQPRRLQEKETSASNKDEAHHDQTTSQFFLTSDNRTNCQPSAAFGPSPHQTTNSGGYAFYRRATMTEAPCGNKRLSGDECGRTMNGPNQNYVSDHTCQNNNHADIGLRNGTYCVGSVSESSVGVPLKSRYYEEYQGVSHQNRSTLTHKQHSVAVHPYSGPYQHQFTYGMQLQQQQHQTYQQSPHLHVLPHQQQPAMSEATRITYVDNCSLSATNSSLSGGDR